MQQCTISKLTACILVAVLLLTGCSSSRFVAYGEGRYSSSGNNVVHVVRKGETLYSIAWQHGHDYRKLAAWNSIPVPYTIYPGQKLTLNNKKQADAPAASKKIRSRPKKTRTVKRHTEKKEKVASKTLNQSTYNKKVTWFWPTTGKIINYFSATDPGKKGLDIAGKTGQPVYAAASGVVVYSGNGLRGYGNLIIIKHNEVYFSAYAHNQKIRVKENEKVKFRQRIADMGSTDTNRPMLHFEIRRNGKPSNPLKYLPKERS